MEKLKKEEEEFSSLLVYATLFKHKKWILSITFLAAVVTAVITYFYLPNEYKSTINVVPPQTSGSAMENALGSISGALKDIGLTKLGGSGGESYSFIVILTSRTVMDSIIDEFDLPKVYDIPKSKMSLVRKKFLENLEVDYERDGNYFISIWDVDRERAAKMTNRFVEVANNVAIKLYREEAELNKKNMEDRMRGTDSTISAIADTLQRFSKRTGLYYPTEQATALSKSLAELKSDEIKYDVIYDYYSNMYGSDDYTTQSILSMREKINEKINEAMSKPGYVGNFSLDDAAKEGIEFLRLYADLETYSKVKAFLTPIVEKNKLDETKKMKNLIVLDAAIPADRKDRPKRSLIVLGATFGAFSLTIFIILIINSIKSLNKKVKEVKD